MIRDRLIRADFILSLIVSLLGFMALVLGKIDGNHFVYIIVVVDGLFGVEQIVQKIKDK